MQPQGQSEAASQAPQPQQQNTEGRTPLIDPRFQDSLSPDVTLDNMPVLKNRAQALADGDITEDGDKAADEQQDTPADTANLVPAEAVDNFAPAVEDPGEFTPTDFSFEITTFEGENKTPRVHKITSPDQWDNLVESDPNFGSPAALLRAQRLATKMESGIEREQAEYEAKKEAFDADQQRLAQSEAQLVAWDNQLDYLSESGKLPKISAAEKDADWNNATNAKRPAIAARVELLQYFAKQNATRARIGMPPFASLVDAYNDMQMNAPSKGTEAVKRQATEQRRQAGAKVAGASSMQTTSAPSGISVGRVLPGGLRDLDAGW